MKVEVTLQNASMEKNMVQVHVTKQ